MLFKQYLYYLWLTICFPFWLPIYIGCLCHWCCYALCFLFCCFYL